MQTGYFPLSRSPQHRMNDALYTFPNDGYNLQITFVVLDHTTNQPVPILRLATISFADNFAPTFSDWATLTYFNESANVTSRTMETNFYRSPLSKAFVLLVFLVNWFLTVMVLFVGLIVFRVKKGEIPDSLLVLPITVILTIPSLRSLMVGSPAFGMYLGDIITCLFTEHAQVFC